METKAPVPDEHPLGDPQLLRYSRHILLDQFGVEAQRRFQNARVLVVGAGGLGCPAAIYLAAAGVGRLVIADPDRIELTNLQRQVLYRTQDLGASKAVQAKAALGELNPEVAVESVAGRLEGARLQQEVAAADLVLDCSDNFPTRHALNRACVAHQKPLVMGAASRFDGQISVFDRRLSDAPCYCCLFPEEGGADEDECATMGVFAPLAGIIGAMQAAEGLKCLALLPGTLNGRLVLLNALQMQWQSIAIERDPKCPVCGNEGALAPNID